MRQDPPPEPVETVGGADPESSFAVRLHLACQEQGRNAGERLHPLALESEDASVGACPDDAVGVRHDAADG